MAIRKSWDEVVSPERKVFSSQLKARRNELSLTQLVLYERTGITPSHLSGMETGKSNPSLEQMAALARALDVDIRFFFEVDSRPLENEHSDEEMG